MRTALTIIFLFFACPAWATPVRVTLFPDSARIEEVTTITAIQTENGFSAQLTLPGQADPKSLRFASLPQGITIADLSWTMRPEADQSALQPLTARLAELKSRHQALSADLEAVRGRLAFWKAQHQAGEKTLSALRELAAELGTALRQETAQSLALEEQLLDASTQIARTEQEIADLAGQERTVCNVHIIFAGPAPQELSYSYLLAHCGWSPLYRLEARPEQNSIDFSWQAKIWQRSGQDWSKVHLLLATLQPDVQGEPETLPDWEILPREIYKSMRAAPAMVMEAMSDQAAPAAPQEIRHSTYAVWDMGQRSFPAGDNRILEIAREAWPASFVHLLRPSLDDKAFVQARVYFEQARELPPGQGFFLMDGALVDQRDFALSDQKAELFFGSDPLVACETVLKEKKTGEKGLLRQKQTFVREWTIIVRNTSKRVVQIRVEEPKPQIRDERIALELKTNPASLSEETAILAWNSTAAPGAETHFNIRLSFEAPEELRIDPGWRW